MTSKVGLDLSALQHRYHHISNTEFMKSSWVAANVWDEEDHIYQRLWNADYPTISQESDYSIKVYEEHLVNSGCVFPHHLQPLIPTKFGETLIIVEFDALMYGSAFIGIAAGIEDNGTTERECNVSVCFAANLNKVGLIVAESGPNIYPWSTLGTGTGRTLLWSSVISNYDVSQRNTYKFIITLSKGVTEAIRLGFMINDELMCQSQSYKDADFEFMNGLHPYIYVSNGGYVKLYGLAMTT